MNQRLGDKGGFAPVQIAPAPLPAISLQTTPAQLPAVIPPKYATAIDPVTQRAVFTEGPYTNLDCVDSQKAGLLRKNFIGLDPITRHEGKNHPVMRAMLTGITRGVMSLGYRVNIEKDDAVLEDLVLRGPIKGALVLLTPHTGYDDPAVVYSNLAPFLSCRPVATEPLFTQPLLKTALGVVKTLPVPNTDNPIGIEEEINLLAVQVVSAMRRGENVGLHPSGRLMRGDKEIIGSNSLVQRILELMPEARILSVKTRGMNGSFFSRAGAKSGLYENPENKSDRQPSHSDPSYLKAAIAHNITHPWQTRFKLVKERRQVDIEISDITTKMRAAGTLLAQNQLLEEIANPIDPEYGVTNPTIHVPLRGDDVSGIHLYQTAKTEEAGSSNVVVDPDVLAKIETTVRDYLAGLTKTAPDKVKPDTQLRDLGLDSLAVNDQVMLWINKSFDRAFLSPEGFKSVQDVIDGASGKLSPVAGIEFKRVSNTFIGQANDTGPAAIPDGSKNIVDAFIRQLIDHPDRVVAIDEVVGEYTNEKLGILVALLIPEMRKIPGERIGMMFPNSVVGTAVQLALTLAGKAPSMINAQWNDEQARSAMELAKVDAVITSQGVIRSLKGKKHTEDAQKVAKGEKALAAGEKLPAGALTQAQVDNDPTNTPFPSIEEKFQVIENVLRQMSDVTAIKKGKIFKWSTKKELIKLAQNLQGTQETVGLFTSGSTGNPKGIAYRHEQVMQSATALASAFQLKKNDVLLHLAPSFHLVGYTAGTMANMMGVATVNVPDPRQAAIAAKIGQLRDATITVGTPSLLNAVCKAAGPNGFPKMTRVVVGAEPLTPSIEANLRAAAPNAQLIQGYGATETGVTFVERFDPRDPADRSLGQPLDGVEYMLVDVEDFSKPAKPGEQGVLLLRGPTIVTPDAGYMGKHPDDAFQVIDGTTWYVSGDIVKEKVIKDPNGVDVTVVQFIDRASRFSKINGEIVPHGGLEKVIAQLLPEPSDGGPRVLVVEGPKNAQEQPTLVAYAVPARDKSGKPVDIHGDPLTYAKVQAALSDAFNGDPKFNVNEVRLVKSIELLGTGKVALSTYKKAVKEPHDGETLTR